MAVLIPRRIQTWLRYGSLTSNRRYTYDLFNEVKTERTYMGSYAMANRTGLLTTRSCTLLVINSMGDAFTLQHDLDRLIDWSQLWQMSFNPDKCKVSEFIAQEAQFYISILCKGLSWNQLTTIHTWALNWTGKSTFLTSWEKLTVLLVLSGVILEDTLMPLKVKRTQGLGDHALNMLAASRTPVPRNT